MTFFIRSTFVCILLLIPGCAATNLESFISPLYGDFRAQHIIIDSRGFSFGEQKQVEARLARALRKTGVQAQSGIRLWPPVRHYSKRKINKIALNAGADAILVVKLEDRAYSREETAYYVPGYFFSYGFRRENHRLAGLRIKLELIDPRSNDVIWVAEGDSVANASSFSTMLETLAEETISLLQENQLI